MAERRLIATHRIASFRKFLHEKGAVELVPKVNEYMRYQLNDSIVSFAKRRGTQHLTTYGIGTDLALEFLHKGRRTNEGSPDPVSKSGQDEVKA